MACIPCEPYSGPVMSRWLDRSLQLGGRITYIKDNKVHFKMIHKPSFAHIPSLAPHMLRGTDAKDWVPEGTENLVCIDKIFANLSIDQFCR